jgi:kynureninase
MACSFGTDLSYAIQKDKNDTLGSFRSRFYFPQYQGKDVIYFCGNSLGLQAKNVAGVMQQELEDWRNLAIGGYLNAKSPWMFSQPDFCKPLSKIMGCGEEEITAMNSLTVNLHLLLLSFYRPGKRYKIMMEAGAFPSDQYAAETQALFYGLDPGKTIIEIRPRTGEKIIREEDILSSIEQNKDSLAIVLFGGINYYSGQLFDIKSIAAAAHKAGALAGFDLAHVAGNLPVQLHDWDVDFAVWCSYKYLNGGPGAVGGAFIHQKYARDKKHTRLGGWWGNEESTRFRMEKGFIPKPDAKGWNLSTTPVFNMAGLKASLQLFEEAGMDKLQAKSRLLTAYLEFLLRQLINIDFQIITPEEPERRGAQLSLYFNKNGKEIHQKMIETGIIVDYREPGVIRVAPAPLYNSFEDVYRFYEILKNFQ